MKSPYLYNLATLLALTTWMGIASAATISTSPTKSGKPAKSEATVGSVLEEAQAAYGRGDRSQALSLINRASRLEPDNPRPDFARARLSSAQGDSAKAIEDFDKVLRLNPAELDVYHLRGVEHFILTQITDAVRDFNQHVALDPTRLPYDWQRGIALYYADQFEEGRKQFEQHQTVNTQDVENAAWHYFCVARKDGAEKARALLLPVSSDSRVPMMQIHALLAGTGSTDQVLTAAASGNASSATQQQQQFYAHLYLGLYYEVQNDERKSREHIEKALQFASKEDYMGKVAMVHSKIRKDQPKAKAKSR